MLQEIIERHPLEDSFLPTPAPTQNASLPSLPPHPWPCIDLRCWGEPRARRRPAPMMPTRPHTASHSSMLQRQQGRGAGGEVEVGGWGGALGQRRHVISTVSDPRMALRNASRVEAAGRQGKAGRCTARQRQGDGSSSSGSMEHPPCAPPVGGQHHRAPAGHLSAQHAPQCPPRTCGWQQHEGERMGGSEGVAGPRGRVPGRDATGTHTTAQITFL